MHLRAITMAITNSRRRSHPRCCDVRVSCRQYCDDDMSSAPATFRIIVRHSIWRVTLDDTFYGDYRSLGLATDAADARAASLRAKGRKVTIAAPTRP